MALEPRWRITEINEYAQSVKLEVVKTAKMKTTLTKMEKTVRDRFWSLDQSNLYSRIIEEQLKLIKTSWKIYKQYNAWSGHDEIILIWYTSYSGQFNLNVLRSSNQNMSKKSTIGKLQVNNCHDMDKS